MQAFVEKYNQWKEGYVLCSYVLGDFIDEIIDLFYEKKEKDSFQDLGINF